MNIELEKLYVLIEAQTEQFKKEMTQVNSSIDKVSSTVNNTTKKASKSFGRLGKMIATIFIGTEINNFLRRMTELSYKADEFKATINASLQALADSITPLLEVIVRWVATAIAFLTGMIRQMFGLKDATDKVNKSTIKLGKTYAGFDELNVIQQDTKQDEVVNSFIDVNKEIEKGKQFWKDWGLLISVVAGLLAAGWLTKFLKNLDVFGSIFKGMKTLFNPAVQAINGYITAVGKVFDTSAWLKTLEGFGAGEEYLLEASDDIALATANLAAAQGKLGLFSKAVLAIQSSLGVSTGAAFAITVGIIIAALVALGGAIYNLWTNNIMGFRDRMVDFWNYLVNLFNEVVVALQPLFDWLTFAFVIVWEAGIKPLWDSFTRFIGAILLGVLDIIEAFKPLIDWFVKYVLPIISYVVGAVIAALSLIIPIIANIVAFLIDGLGGAIASIATFITGTVKNILTVISNLWKSIEQIWKGITQLFSGDAKQLANGVGNIFLGIIGGFMSVILGFINFVIDMINGLFKFVNSFKVPDWIPGLGGKSMNFKLIEHLKMPKMPQLANGGMVDAGSLFVAGEAGAEMIGSHNGKTTVMPLENTSFVAAIGTAVYGAVAAALNENTGGSTTIVVDGMTLAKSVESNLNKLSLAKGGLDIAL